MSDESLKTALENIAHDVSDILLILRGEDQRSGIIDDVNTLKAGACRHAKIIWITLGAVIPLLIATIARLLGIG